MIARSGIGSKVLLAVALAALAVALTAGALAWSTLARPGVVPPADPRRAALILAVAAAVLCACALVALSAARRIAAPLRKPAEHSARVQAEAAEHLADERRRAAGVFADTLIALARRQQDLLACVSSLVGEFEQARVEMSGSHAAVESRRRLDHLTTRIGRAADSLLVLAGVQSSRSTDRPMSLRDSVQAAVAGVEHAERVACRLQTDPIVAAAAAPALVHLIGELVERAVNRSEATSTVDLVAVATDVGVRVSVHDRGASLTEDELDEVNARLSAEVPGEPVVPVDADGIGLSVLGRLAARLGSTVRLHAAPGRGTVAVVDVPAGLLGAWPSPTPSPRPSPLDLTVPFDDLGLDLGPEPAPWGPMPPQDVRSGSTDPVPVLDPLDPSVPLAWLEATPPGPVAGPVPGRAVGSPPLPVDRRSAVHPVHPVDPVDRDHPVDPVRWIVDLDALASLEDVDEDEHQDDRGGRLSVTDLMSPEAWATAPTPDVRLDPAATVEIPTVGDHGRGSAHLDDGFDHIDPDHIDPDHIDPDHIDPDHIDPDHVHPDHVHPDDATAPTGAPGGTTWFASPSDPGPTVVDRPGWPVRGDESSPPRGAPEAAESMLPTMMNVLPARARGHGFRLARRRPVGAPAPDPDRLARVTGSGAFGPGGWLDGSSGSVTGPEPRSVSPRPPSPHPDGERQRSTRASEALHELSQLSTVGAAGRGGDHVQDDAAAAGFPRQRGAGIGSAAAAGEGSIHQASQGVDDVPMPVPSGSPGPSYDPLTDPLPPFAFESGLSRPDAGATGGAATR